ncbi:hypothetical protein HBB16_07000 [Pseudonocardia sp. MCCB 268]|nr:hypothetical protein [Pseudonocardia cytotoxica]
MSMNPDLIEQIRRTSRHSCCPRRCSEKFVSLVLPAAPATTRLAAGDVIPEDRSQDALEVERVLDELLPLLQTVRPQDLATTPRRVVPGPAGPW